MSVEIGNYLQINRSGHYFDMADHFMSRNYPMDYLLFWVLTGGGYVETAEQQIQAKPGDLISLLPHQPHTYGADPKNPWEIVWVHFQGELAEPFVETIREYGGVRVELGLDAEIRDRWVELVVAHAAREAGFALRCDTALAALLGLIVFRLQLHTIVPEQETPLDVHTLQTYIHHHLREPITLADLARQANLSPTHFARVFKKQFAVSPMYYVIQKRVALACSLLTETSMRMKQISEAVGYDDPYYFSRIFRKVMAVSPTEYRVSHRPGSRGAE